MSVSKTDLTAETYGEVVDAVHTRVAVFRSLILAFVRASAQAMSKEGGMSQLGSGCIRSEGDKEKKQT